MKGWTTPDGCVIYMLSAAAQMLPLCSWREIEFSMNSRHSYMLGEYMSPWTELTNSPASTSKPAK